MIAIGIFALVLAAIYSSWTSILRASKTGLAVAASAQRARITIRVLEDSLGSAQSFAANLPYYSFDAENGTDASLSFVARLSKSFPRSGKFGDLDVRRVTFSVEPAPDGGRQLVLRQNPLVMDLDQDEKEYPLVLAKNVKGFEMQFWEPPPRSDWVDEWREQKTNQLPALVMVTLRLADDPHSSRVTEEITRIISLPAVTVQPPWQVPSGQPRAPGAPGGPGGPPGPGQPGAPGTLPIGRP
jgi:hypothetical protein